MIAEFVLDGCRLPTRPIANCLFLCSEKNLCAIVFKWKKSKKGKKRNTLRMLSHDGFFFTPTRKTFVWALIMLTVD